MATRTYWYQDRPIWVVEHAGRFGIGDLLWAAFETRRVMHVQPLYVLVDMTEIMVMPQVFRQVRHLRTFDAFITPRNIELMVFVIPGLEESLLYEGVMAHQKENYRLGKTRFYNQREAALHDLLEITRPTQGA